MCLSSNGNNLVPSSKRGKIIYSIYQNENTVLGNTQVLSVKRLQTSV